MRGVANAQQAVGVPVTQPIHPDVQMLDVVHRRQRSHRSGHVWK